MPGLPSGKQVVHDAGPLGIGKELRPEADEASRRNSKFQPYAAAAVVDHLRRDASTSARLRDDDSLKFIGNVDDEVLDRLHLHAVDVPGHDVGAGDLELVAFLRIISMRMDSCSSPRPITFTCSGVSVSSTRSDTLPRSSRASRSRRFREVTY